LIRLKNVNRCWKTMNTTISLLLTSSIVRSSRSKRKTDNGVVVNNLIWLVLVKVQRMSKIYKSPIYSRPIRSWIWIIKSKTIRLHLHSSSSSSNSNHHNSLKIIKFLFLNRTLWFRMITIWKWKWKKIRRI